MGIQVGEGQDLFDDVTGEWVGVLDRKGREQLVASSAQSKLLPFMPVLRPLSAVGTYAGTGSALTVTVGWVPDLFIVKDVVNGTAAVWAVSAGSWLGKSLFFVGAASTNLGPVINLDGTVTIGTGASVNTAAANYEWFAYKDNGSGSLLLCNHSGNDRTTRTLRYAKGARLKAALFKRDSTALSLLAFAGKTSRLVDGSAGTATTIGNDGVVTTGQGADINQWTSNLGEGTGFVGFVDGAQGVYVTTYIGTGASKPLMTPFTEIEAALIFPRGASGLAGAFWTSRLAAGTTLSVDVETAATVGAQAITAVNNGRITLGTSGRCNALGIEYALIAFRKNRQGAIAESAPMTRPLRSTKYLNMSAGAYVNCGTDDSLKISLAITMEWWGCHFFSTPTSYPTSATNNDNTALQQPLIWRSNGADGVSGSVSYGLLIMPAQSTGTANPLGVGETDIFDLPQNAASYDVDNNQPWCTGAPILPRTLTHVVVTHDSVGFWRVYVNGVLVKERDRNMLQAPTPRPNVAGGSGHTFCIGARKRTTTPEMTAYTQAFYGARVYNRELTAAEALANYNSLFSDNATVATSDFVEQWLPENVSGATLAATNRSANNGTIVGTAVVEGT